MSLQDEPGEVVMTASKQSVGTTAFGLPVAYHTGSVYLRLPKQSSEGQLVAAYVLSTSTVDKG